MKTEKEIIANAKNFNGSIENIEDIFIHMNRLQKCSSCKKDFYDKLCPDCRKKEIDFYIKQTLSNVNKLIDELFYVEGLPMPIVSVNNVLKLKEQINKLEKESPKKWTFIWYLTLICWFGYPIYSTGKYFYKKYFKAERQQKGKEIT